MKKEEILSKLGGIENAEKIAEAILAINAQDVENATKSNASSEELNNAKSELEKAKEELKKYEKGGEKYIDDKDYHRLKAFEEETNKQKEEKRRADALSNLFEENAVPASVRKILSKVVGDITVGEDNKVSDGNKLIADLRQEYAELFKNDGKGRAGLGNKSKI